METLVAHLFSLLTLISIMIFLDKYHSKEAANSIYFFEDMFVQIRLPLFPFIPDFT